jgi:hypothetical protein
MNTNKSTQKLETTQQTKYITSTNRRIQQTLLMSCIGIVTYVYYQYRQKNKQIQTNNNEISQSLSSSNSFPRNHSHEHAIGWHPWEQYAVQMQYRHGPVGEEKKKPPSKW